VKIIDATTREYRGVLVHRCQPNGSGMRWHTVGSRRGGSLKADTLAGIKSLIRHDIDPDGTTN
jgi:hypothetical protein